MRLTLRVAPSAALASLLCTPLFADEVVTSFEFDDSSGSFILGTAPKTATFLNGAATASAPLSHTGANAWLIAPGQTGTVDFGTPAESVELWVRDEFAANGSVVRAFDPEGGPLATVNVTPAFQKVTLDATALGAKIGTVTLKNNGAAGSAAADDLTYCAAVGAPIPDPIPAPIAPGDVPVQLVPIAEGLIAPNWGTAAPVGDRLFVTDQPGVLYAVDVRTGEKTVFLDVSAKLIPLGVAGPNSFDERGLLGVTFHPDYANNGLLYTYTSRPTAGVADFPAPLGASENHHAVISEWKVANPTATPNAADPSTLVDPNSERELLRVGEPQFNHDGGTVLIGPDGMLYVSLGDGGSADDQGTGHVTGGNGQDPSNVLGTVLRIDPNGNDSANGNYGVPNDNPFVGVSGFVDEIWAYGLRNPFRFSFDVGTPLNPGTGDLLLADVGQNDIEEIDVVTKGGNYGWPCKEGSFFFDMNGSESGFVTDIAPHVVPPGLIDPIAEYDHDEGIAIIGGFVYRGAAIPPLSGRYVFGEFGQTFSSDGRLFHLDANDTPVEFPLVGQAAVGRFVLGFGEDRLGELYALVNDTGIPFPDSGGQATGAILRLAPDAPFVDLALGKAGSGDVVPRLQGSGTLTPGSANAVTLSSAPAHAPFAFVVGGANASTPFLDGTLVPSPSLVLFGFLTDVRGIATVPFTWPANATPGQQVFVQAWVEDAAATFGLSATNGLQLTGQ